MNNKAFHCSSRCIRNVKYDPGYKNLVRAISRFISGKKLVEPCAVSQIWQHHLLPCLHPCHAPNLISQALLCQPGAPQHLVWWELCWRWSSVLGGELRQVTEPQNLRKAWAGRSLKACLVVTQLHRQGHSH